MTPAAKRKVVAHPTGWANGGRVEPSVLTYDHQIPDDRAIDSDLRQRMRAIAQERRRLDYRRLHILLKREGYLVNHKKRFRLYGEEKLAVHGRGGRSGRSGPQHQ